MKMKAWDGKKSREDLDTYYTLVPLNYILKIFSLSCTYRDGTQIKASWPYFQNILMLALLSIFNLYSIYFKMNNQAFIAINVSIRLTDGIQMTFECIRYCVDLYFVHHYGRTVCLEYFKLYENIDETLNFTRYSDVRTTIIRFIMFFLAIFFISNCSDYFAWFTIFGWIPPTVYTIDYIYFFIKILTILDIICNVLQVQYRLCVIGNHLQERCCSLYATQGREVDVIANKNWLHQHDRKKETRVDSLKTVCSGRYCETEKLSDCYLLLLEQCDYINTMYGFRVVLNCTSILIDMVTFLNLTIRTVMKSSITDNYKGYLPAASSILRLFSVVGVIVSLVHSCEKCYRQTDRIICIIDHLLNKKRISNELKLTITNLRSLVLSRPINFHGFQFFRLDYTLLVSMSSVVVTYTIILLQSIN